MEIASKGAFFFFSTYLLVFHKINCMLHKFHVLWKRICMKIRTLHWPSDMIIDFAPLFITCIGAEHIVKKCMILNSRIYLEAVHTTVIVSEQTLGQICNRSLGATGFRSWKRGQWNFFHWSYLQFSMQCSKQRAICRWGLLSLWKFLSLPTVEYGHTARHCWLQRSDKVKWYTAHISYRNSSHNQTQCPLKDLDKNYIAQAKDYHRTKGHTR